MLKRALILILLHVTTLILLIDWNKNVALYVFSLHMANCVGNTKRDTGTYSKQYVLEGGVAEFTCTVTGRETANTEIWWHAAFLTTGYVLWQYSATSKKIVHGDLTENLEFEDHNNTSNEAEMFILRIINVTKSDNQFSFGCVHAYTNSVTHSLLGNLAKLVVWTKPTGHPQCGYEGINISTIISSSNHQITLTCFIDGGDPLPKLRWYKTNQNGLMLIGGPYSNSLSVNQHITASDHGREYICQAEIGATPGEPLTCKLIPYNPMPEISVTSNKQMYQIEERISILCNNTGISTVDTSYLWYINDILTSASSHDGITITNTMKSSTIFISKYPFSSDTIEVTCEGVIPNVASANAT